MSAILKYIRTSFILLLMLVFNFYAISTNAADNLISLFPLDKYDQKITDWVSPSDPSYTQPVLTPAQQAKHKAELYRNYFGELSPWNANYVNFLFSQPVPYDLQSLEEKKINSFTNQNQPEDKIGYGANFRPYTQQWLDQIKNNVNLKQFTTQHYDPAKRAIAIVNIEGRVLPTDEPHFYSYQIGGQGYPFDNIQASAIWAGTPLYILGETQDHAWSMVLAPSFIAWVKSSDIASVNNRFVKQWLKTAQQHLAAITNTQVSIVDNENNLFRFSGYIGMLFPAITYPNNIEILIPVRDKQGQARIYHAKPPLEDVALIPVQPTPEHFANIIQHLLGRTYGWGSMYFYNDCASELKNLYTVFGIWLAMHSSNQVDPQQVLGSMVDLSASDTNARRTYLMEHGHPWMTVIYIGGHVLDYIGSYPDPIDPMHPVVPLSYQNMWGLHVANSPERRVMIGQSILLPLLLSYPEDPTLISHLQKPIFQLFYLDEIPEMASLKKKAKTLSVLLSP